ncbi:hypothetical protein D3C81_2208670 [compost metagenome]
MIDLQDDDDESHEGGSTQNGSGDDHRNNEHTRRPLNINPALPPGLILLSRFRRG